MKNQLLDNPKPLGQIMEISGFGSGAINTPSIVTESQGFKMALAETGLKEALIAEGIDSKKIAEKVNVLLNATDKEGIDDYTAIDKGLKHATAIYGIVQDKPPEAQKTYNFIFSTDVQEKVKHMEAEIKNLLTQNVEQTQKNVEVEQEEPRDTGETY